MLEENKHMNVSLIVSFPDTAPVRRGATSALLNEASDPELAALMIHSLSFVLLFSRR